MNLIGRKIGRLEVITNASRKGFVVCKCDCGKIHEVRASSLTKKNPTVSCGCYRSEVMSNIGRNTIRQNSEERLEIIAKYGTSYGSISNPNPPVSNKSGYKGVWFDQVHGVYQAYITFKRKRYSLGSYKSLADAVKARKDAEEKLYAPVIAAIQAEKTAQ